MNNLNEKYTINKNHPKLTMTEKSKIRSETKRVNQRFVEYQKNVKGDNSLEGFSIFTYIEGNPKYAKYITTSKSGNLKFQTNFRGMSDEEMAEYGNFIKLVLEGNSTTTKAKESRQKYIDTMNKRQEQEGKAKITEEVFSVMAELDSLAKQFNVTMSDVLLMFEDLMSNSDDDFTERTMFDYMKDKTYEEWVILSASGVHIADENEDIFDENDTFEDIPI